MTDDVGGRGASAAPAPDVGAPTDPVLTAHADRLRCAVGRLRAARQRFLEQQFTGYVADTYYVDGEGYYCWPAATDDGVFLGYDDLLDAERDALSGLLAAGFSLVGVGLSRVVLAPPAPHDDRVVKLARAGWTPTFGDGRMPNRIEATVEARYGSDGPSGRLADAGASDDAGRTTDDGGGAADDTDTVDDARATDDGGATGDTDATADSLPAVPVLATTADHRILVAPRVDPLDEVPDASERAALAAAFEAVEPALDRAELSRPENCCRLAGRLVTLDYGEPAALSEPRGVPPSVDRAAVRAAVDDARERGTKPDLAPGGGVAGDAAAD